MNLLYLPKPLLLGQLIRLYLLEYFASESAHKTFCGDEVDIERNLANFQLMAKYDKQFYLKKLA